MQFIIGSVANGKKFLDQLLGLLLVQLDLGLLTSMEVSSKELEILGHSIMDVLMILELDLEGRFGSLGAMLLILMETLKFGDTMELKIGIKFMAEVLIFQLTSMEIHMFQTYQAQLTGETQFIHSQLLKSTILVLSRSSKRILALTLNLISHKLEVK